MVMEKFSRTDLKFMSLAFLFAGLAYVFVDVATSGIINIYSVIAYMVVLIGILSIGPAVSEHLN